MNTKIYITPIRQRPQRR